jgi:RNA polymerase sigma-70 factor, ECF subfamily
MREAAEAEIGSRCSVGDYSAAATLILNEYGPEISSLLCSRLCSEASGQEVYSMFCEDLWRGLPGFQRRCSVRTWVYVLARHAELRYRSEPQRRPHRNLPLEDEAQLLARSRTSTAPYCKTRFRERMRELRRRLNERDELILLLRIDRKLAWSEIACVLSQSQSLEVDSALLAREAAALRQHFRVIKRQLRRWAEAEGLLPPTSPAVHQPLPD